MSVSVLMLRTLLDECRGRGIVPAQLLVGSDLSPEQLADGAHRIPAEAFEHLAQRALRLTGDPALGLALGNRLPAQALQVVGYLLSSAPSMRHAYADFQRYAALLAEHPSWTMREADEHARFEFRCLIPRPTSQRMANDWSLSLAYRVILAFAPNGGSSLVRVSLSHPAPAELAAYVELFGTAVRFGQARNAITFPRAWLDLAQAHGDAVTCEGLRELAERLLVRIGAQRALGEELRLMLAREPQRARLGGAEVARRWGLSLCALRRRLAIEGISPLQLVDEARCRMACTELSHARRPLKQLADRLGYADVSSFHRAFKRWTGQTPADYRTSVLQAGHRSGVRVATGQAPGPTPVPSALRSK
jgi:AraC-like DNA-binding protein